MWLVATIFDSEDIELFHHCRKFYWHSCLLYLNSNFQMTLTLEHSVLWLKQLPLIRILALPNCDFQDTVQMSPYSVKSFLTKSPTYTLLVTSLFGPPLHFMQTSTLEPQHSLSLIGVHVCFPWIQCELEGWGRGLPILLIFVFQAPRPMPDI